MMTPKSTEHAKFYSFKRRSSFGIRKFTIGVVSVSLGTALVATAPAASADTLEPVSSALAAPSAELVSQVTADKTALAQALSAAQAIDLSQQAPEVAEGFVELFARATALLEQVDAEQAESDTLTQELRQATLAFTAELPTAVGTPVEVAEADVVLPAVSDEEVTEEAETLENSLNFSASPTQAEQFELTLKPQSFKIYHEVEDPNLHPSLYFNNFENLPIKSYEWDVAPVTSIYSKEGQDISIKVVYHDNSFDIVTGKATVDFKFDYASPKLIKGLEVYRYQTISAEELMSLYDYKYSSYFTVERGSHLTWLRQPEFNQVGVTSGLLGITYPDGTIDELEIPVTVRDNIASTFTLRIDADPTIYDHSRTYGGVNSNDSDVRVRYEYPNGKGFNFRRDERYYQLSELKIPFDVVRMDTGEVYGSFERSFKDLKDSTKNTFEFTNIPISSDTGQKIRYQIVSKIALPEGLSFRGHNYPFELNYFGYSATPSVIVDLELQSTTIVELEKFKQQHEPEIVQGLVLPIGSVLPETPDEFIINRASLPQDFKYAWYDDNPRVLTKPGKHEFRIVTNYPEGFGTPLVTVFRDGATGTVSKLIVEVVDGKTQAQHFDEFLATDEGQLILKRQFPHVWNLFWSHGTNRVPLSGRDVSENFEYYSSVVNMEAALGKPLLAPKFFKFGYDGYSPIGKDYSVEWVNQPNTSLVQWENIGSKPVAHDLAIRHKDGSVSLVKAMVRIVAMADVFPIQYKTDLSTALSTTLLPSDTVINQSYLPEGTRHEWLIVPSAMNGGQIKTTFPDGSYVLSPVINVSVLDSRPQADRYNPTALVGGLTLGINDPIDPAQLIGNRSDLPSDARFEFVEPVGEPLSGTSKIVSVRIIFSDGSVRTVRSRLKFRLTQAQEFIPEVQSLRVSRGASIRPIDFIKNASSLPANTRYSWSQEPSTRVPGGRVVQIIVTYPDGSTDIITVRFTVR